MEVSNFYLTGSFVKGDAAGHAEPPLIEVSSAKKSRRNKQNSYKSFISLPIYLWL